MGRISKYGKDTSLTGTEKWIGTDVDDDNKTKNYELNDVKDFVLASIPESDTYFLYTEPILTVESTAAQIANSLDTPEKVVLANGESADMSVNITVAGDLTSVVDQYLSIEVNLSLFRPSGNPDANIYVRNVVDNIQVGAVKSFSISGTEEYKNANFIIEKFFEAGEVMSVEFMVDAMNTPVAGLNTMVPNNPVWGPIPSARVDVYRKTVEIV